MSSTVRIVNPNTYEFIQSIATQFDRTKFHEDAPPPLIPYSQNQAIDGIKKEIKTTYNPEAKKWEPCEASKVLSGRKIGQQMIKDLPEEMVGHIAAQAHNFSEWVVILGLTDPEVPQQPAAMDVSAKELLSCLEVQRNHQSAREQLLSVVFEEVFKNSSAEEQMRLIQRMNQCTTTIESLSFRVRFAIFRVQAAVARFFGNPLVRLVLSGWVAWQAAKVYSAARTFYDRYAASYYVPKAINLLINRVPIRVIPLISGVISVVQYVAKRQFRLTILFGIVSIMIPGQSGYRPYFNKIKSVVLLPATLSSFFFRYSFSIFVNAFSASATVQKMLAESAKEGSQQSQSKIIAQDASKAYQLWMYLMLNPESLYTK